MDAGELTPLVYAGIAVSMVCVLIADFFTPLGIAVWVIYLVPVTLSLWLWRPELPYYVAGIATSLILLSFLTDDEGVRREVAAVNRIFGAATVWIIAVVGNYFIRSKLAVREQEWMQRGQVELSTAMGGDLRLEQLGDKVLTHLAAHLDAQVGAFFARKNLEFVRVATLGVPVDGAPSGFKVGDGLLGDAVKNDQSMILRNVPDGYLTLGSALGKASPRTLVIGCMKASGLVGAVVELGFLRPVGEEVLEFLDRVSDSVAVAVRSADYRAHLQALLEETQRQGAELQAQSEELRVSNEELEEQSRALRESQSRLELQQTELEQSNAQLEEQTTLLEGQRDDLQRAKALLESQARELERASQYKSDFLANMSHELRTPLNSSLILASLLAENPAGNLSEEQVKYARTIQAAGNDLLVLINDILDLSKIEAGHLEVHPDSVSVANLVESLKQTFEPLAQQKGLSFVTLLAPDCPETIISDQQRLNQILKNLLSNATKFTEQGEVRLDVSLARDGRLSLSVKDTGIGIPEDQQQIVFEAFRQADGTTNRKYGGTGLGLSISRQLTHLLGGELQLQSQPGQGTTFTVLLPVELKATTSSAATSSASSTVERSVLPAAEKRLSSGSASSSTPLPDSGSLPRGRVADDRSRLRKGSRVLLIVEDDENFARILYELAHESHFQCLVATTAEEALELVSQFVPNAVVLDVGLPDHSGLSVLDRLKHDARTRHIPVHVVSGGDHAETALSLGAVGYVLKPVKREELTRALQDLGHRLDRTMRRVLVVEDDRVQRESLQSLLGSHEVETIGAGTAAECLSLLTDQTFDCMVLDLSLPDASGYSLLETLSREDAYSFPPVIVYTGRDLSADEEQQLRKYSKSIIIKGAKSPERLLDEVTLFLHQVVSELPPEQQQMLERARSRDAVLEGRRILIVEDDVRNVFALTSILEPRGAKVQIARNGREALDVLKQSLEVPEQKVDLVLMDVMMPEMDGLTATRELRKRPEWKRLPVIMLTAKAMSGDQQKCVAAGASDYLAKPLDVEKLLSLVRVWMPR